MGNFICESLSLCGDFNTTWCVKERKSMRVLVRFEDLAPFNNFIDENLSVNLPLGG